MKSLVISPQPFFSPRGTPFSVYYRTLVTAEQGVKIDLLTYGEGENVSIDGVRIVRIPRFRMLGNVKTGPSFLKLFLDMVMIVWTIGLLLRNRYDFVHAHEESVFYCRFLKPIFKFKLVYDMHSSLPQQLTNFQFTKSRFLIGLFKKLEDSCLKASDVVITICPDLAEYALKIINDKSKHFLIENSIFEPISMAKESCCPSENQNTGNDEKLLQKLPDNKRLIVYAGTLEHYQGIEIIIGAFKKVISGCPDAFLLIVGGTPEQVKHYSDMAERSGLGQYVIFTGRVSQAAAKLYNKMASLLLSPRNSGTNTPLKIYELLASGIPIVATNIYSHLQVLNEDVAFLVEPEPGDMARGILAALNSASDRDRITENAKRLYDDKYSRKIYENKMQRLLAKLS